MLWLSAMIGTFRTHLSMLMELKGHGKKTWAIRRKKFSSVKKSTICGFACWPLTFCLQFLTVIGWFAQVLPLKFFCVSWPLRTRVGFPSRVSTKLPNFADFSETFLPTYIAEMHTCTQTFARTGIQTLLNRDSVLSSRISGRTRNVAANFTALIKNFATFNSL